MACEFGRIDCQNTEKCYLCIDESQYRPPKNKPQGLKKNTIKTKNTGRMGAASEVKSYEQMKKALNTDVTGTPNSGAGKVKGDEQIRGLINVMVELKTTVRKNLNKEPGKETFTIQRAWLDKLEREAKAENMEFQYLKFSFKEHDDKFYCVTNDDQIIDMIVTMKHDREKFKRIQNEVDVHKRRTELIEAENTKLLAEIELLKAQLKVATNDYKIGDFNGYIR
jgi:hypothetical protein